MRTEETNKILMKKRRCMCIGIVRIWLEQNSKRLPSLGIRPQRTRCISGNFLCQFWSCLTFLKTFDGDDLIIWRSNGSPKS